MSGPAPTRAEGYKLGVQKEQAGLDLAEDFMRSRLDLEPIEITDPEMNWRRGDFDLGDFSAEVKRQPIDPERYRLNFVELFEVTSNPRHRGGFETVCRCLGVDPVDAATWTYLDHRDRTQAPLGYPDPASCSIRSMATARWTIYANPDLESPLIYLYDSASLLARCADLAARDGLHRAMGRSNQDTFAVLVPNALRRWVRREGQWVWVGVGDERQALVTLGL